MSHPSSIDQALEKVGRLRQKMSEFEASLAGMVQACDSQSAQELGELRHSIPHGTSSVLGSIDVGSLPSEVQIALRQTLYQAHSHAAQKSWADTVNLVNEVSVLLRPPTDSPPSEQT